MYIEQSAMELFCYMMEYHIKSPVARAIVALANKKGAPYAIREDVMEIMATLSKAIEDATREKLT